MTSYSLRPATHADSATLLRWRNDPTTRQWTRTTHAITQAEHESWLAGVLADPRRLLYMLERDGLEVASVRLDLSGETDDEAEVSIAVAPQARGQGVGSRALNAVAAELSRTAPGVTSVLAVINRDNEASLGLFTKAGYQPRTPSDPTWLELVLTL